MRPSAASVGSAGVVDAVVDERADAPPVELPLLPHAVAARVTTSATTNRPGPIAP
jgi:hypothetical protein